MELEVATAELGCGAFDFWQADASSSSAIKGRIANEMVIKSRRKNLADGD
jgi:hypothetical protein